MEMSIFIAIVILFIRNEMIHNEDFIEEIKSKKNMPPDDYKPYFKIGDKVIVKGEIREESKELISESLKNNMLTVLKESKNDPSFKTYSIITFYNATVIGIPVFYGQKYVVECKNAEAELFKIFVDEECLIKAS